MSSPKEISKWVDRCQTFFATPTTLAQIPEPAHVSASIKHVLRCSGYEPNLFELASDAALDLGHSAWKVSVEGPTTEHFGYGLDNSDRSGSVVALAECLERVTFQEQVLRETSNTLFHQEVILANVSDCKYISMNRLSSWFEGSYLPDSDYYALGMDLLHGGFVGVPEVLLSGCVNRLIRTNSGTALHWDGSLAVNSSLLEMVERDVVLKNWLVQNPPGPATASAWIEVSEIASFLEQHATTLAIGAYRSESALSVIVVTLWSEAPDKPAFVCGTGAGFTEVAAVQKALREALTNWLFLSSNISAHLSTDNRHPEDQAHAYLDRDARRRMEAFFLDTHSQKPRDERIHPTSSVSQLVQEYEPVVIPLLLSSGDGVVPLSCVTVVSEKAIPLLFGQWPTLVPASLHRLGNVDQALLPLHPY